MQDMQSFHDGITAQDAAETSADPVHRQLRGRVAVTPPEADSGQPWPRQFAGVSFSPQILTERAENQRRRTTVDNQRPQPDWIEWKDRVARTELSRYSRDELMDALVHSLRSDPKLTSDNTGLSRLRTFCELIHTQIDCHENRYSRQRYHDMFMSVAPHVPDLAGLLRRGCFVDVGCGSWNPFAQSAIFLACGARRSVAIDLDAPHNLARSVRSVAEVWGHLMLQPRSILGTGALTPAALAENLAGFDLDRIANGDPGALLSSRLEHHLCDAAKMPVENGASTVAVSNAFLEHVADPIGVARELFRIAAPGAYQVHVIDATDHRRYTSPRYSAGSLLAEDEYHADMNYTVDGINYHMNGLRPRQFCGVFESVGFRVLHYQGWQEVELPRGRLAAPFRDLDPAMLREGMGRLVLTKT